MFYLLKEAVFVKPFKHYENISGLETNRKTDDKYKLKERMLVSK